METISQIVAKALDSDVDLTDHFNVVDWCMRNVDQFHLLGTHERHNKASHVQMEAAVLTSAIDQHDSHLNGVSLSVETAFSLALNAMENDILSRYPLDRSNVPDADSLCSWAKEHVHGVADLNDRACQRLTASALTFLAQHNTVNTEFHAYGDDSENTMVKMEVEHGPTTSKEDDYHENTMFKEEDYHESAMFKEEDENEDTAFKDEYDHESTTFKDEYGHESTTFKEEDDYEASRRNKFTNGPLQERTTKTKKEKRPRVNSISESAIEIASRFPKEDISIDRPLAVWAWCVLNVTGFAESHQHFCKDICDAIVSHLREGDGAHHMDETGNEHQDWPSAQKLMKSGLYDREECIRIARDNKRRRLDESWETRVRESTESIARRIPRYTFNYSVTKCLKAWCILHVDGFAESGVNWRQRTTDKISSILMANYGPYESKP